MTVTSKTIPAHVKEQTVLASTTCDLCRQVQKSKGETWLRETEWGNDMEWSVTQISITHRYRHDEGDYTKEVVDICDTCFREKLVPWLRQQGANLRCKERWE